VLHHKVCVCVCVSNVILTRCFYIITLVDTLAAVKEDTGGAAEHMTSTSHDVTFCRVRLCPLCVEY